MIDLNALPIEAGDVPQVDFNNYQDPTEFAPPIREGTYAFKTTKADIEKFEAGVVSFIMDHEAYDKATGTKAGALNFDRISTKVFQRNGVPASMAADMLRACGITERPNSPRAWGEAVLSIKSWCEQGNTWDGAVQWDGYCDHADTTHATEYDHPKNADGKRPAGSKPLATQPQGHAMPFSPRGEKNWPLLAGANGSGERAAVVACPTCGKEVQARAKISRRIPRS